MAKIQTLNPATGVLEREFSPMSQGALEESLARSARAFASYRRTDFLSRGRWMIRAASLLEDHASEFGELMTCEMGKPLESSVAEVRKCAWNCRYYAEHAHHFLIEEKVDMRPSIGTIHYEPLGTVLAVMPWNFPFWQVFRFAAPSLMAGNAVLLKHASNVPQCALAIEKIFLEAGFPEGVFQTLLIGSDKVASLIADDRIAAVTVTGSQETGRAVAEAAAKALKKAVLELGGSDPFIVLPSADLDMAAHVGAEARMINSGQSCIAAKRFIVAESVADEFERKFTDKVRSLRAGDPMDPHTQIGPLATADLLSKLEGQVTRSIELGAKALVGGRKTGGEGYFFEPTVLTSIPQQSPARTEEIFGPVASLFRARDDDHALEIANETRFGLGASVWTKNAAERDFFSRELESGSVFVNQMVASDPRIPFGGIKESGHGRELGRMGLLEFVNVKSVVVR
jgi:succinate-semialdehyde dehydrogenase/glutarate-semialdehyde dehydrogenase